MFLLRLLRLTDAIPLAHYYHHNEAFHHPWMPLRPAGFTSPAFQETRLRHYLERHNRGEQYQFGIFTFTDPNQAEFQTECQPKHQSKYYVEHQPEIKSEHQLEQLIGLITLAAVEREFFQNGRLGYSIDQQFQGRGVITTHLQQVMQFAFKQQNLHRLEASILPHNLASRRVLEKCGFKKIGYAPQYLQIQGVWQDHELYMVLAEELQASPHRSS